MIEIDFESTTHPGLILKKYLSEIGMTQRKFANKCGMPFQNISIFLLGHQDYGLVPLLRIEKALYLYPGSLMRAMAEYIIFTKPKEQKFINREEIYDLKTRNYIYDNVPGDWKKHC